jgi:hypothetical protein
VARRAVPSFATNLDGVGEVFVHEGEVFADNYPAVAALPDGLVDAAEATTPPAAPIATAPNRARRPRSRRFLGLARSVRPCCWPWTRTSTPRSSVG